MKHTARKNKALVRVFVKKIGNIALQNINKYFLTIFGNY